MITAGLKKTKIQPAKNLILEKVNQEFGHGPPHWPIAGLWASHSFELIMLSQACKFLHDVFLHR